MAPYPGIWSEFQTPAPRNKFGNVESEKSRMNSKIINDTNMIWTVLSQQSEMISHLTEQVKYLSNVVTTLITELKTSRRYDYHNDYFEHQTDYTNYYYSEENWYCSWCGSNNHLWETCYRRLGKCFRCGSSNHQVANCIQPSYSSTKCKLESSPRRSQNGQHGTPERNSTPTHVNTENASDKLLPSPVSEEVILNQDDQPQTVLKSSLVTDAPMCTILPNEDSKFDSKINPSSVSENVPTESSVPSSNAVVHKLKPDIQVNSKNCVTDSSSNSLQAIVNETPAYSKENSVCDKTLITNKGDINSKNSPVTEPADSTSILKKSNFSESKNMINREKNKEEKSSSDPVIEKKPSKKKSKVKLNKNSEKPSVNESINLSTPKSEISFDRHCKVGIVSVVKPGEKLDSLEKEMLDMIKDSICHGKDCNELGEYRCDYCYHQYSRFVVYCTKECFSSSLEEHLKTHTGRAVPCKEKCSSSDMCKPCRKSLYEMKSQIERKMNRYEDLRERLKELKKKEPVDWDEFQCEATGCTKFGYYPCKSCPDEYACLAVWCSYTCCDKSKHGTYNPGDGICRKDCKTFKCDHCKEIGSKRRKDKELRMRKHELAQICWVENPHLRKV